MLAIPNSRGKQPRRPAPQNLLGSAPRIALLFAAAHLWLGPAALFAAETPATQADIVARVKKDFAQARTRYRSETNNFEAGWQFARACFDRAEYATNNVEREKIAEEGIAVSRRLIEQRPTSVESHYYLGMNLGQLARTKTLGALRLVTQMETEFTAAHILDERFDFAGPNRNLGLLYLEAPSFGSIGSRTKARHFLRRAVELAPDFPENRLNLLEAYLKWGDRADAQRELKSIEALWPAAREKLSGDIWLASWMDWERRLKAAKKKMDK